MSTYKVNKTGHDVVLGSLTDLDPQPAGGGIRVTQRSHALTGAVNDQGEYVELEFDVADDATAYQSILNQFGVQSALTNEVTVYVRDQTFAFVRKNGLAVQPEVGRGVEWDRYFPRRITILIRDLSDPA